MKNLIILFLFFSICMSCKEEKCQLLIDAYNEVELCKKQEGLECILNHLDSTSLAFVSEISDKKNHTFEAIYSIAKKYKLELTCTRYLKHCRATQYKEKNDIALLKFLSLNSMKWLSPESDYILAKDKVRCADGQFVGITRKDHHGNRLTWLRFVPEDDKINLNLIYSMQLHEIAEWKFMKNEFYNEYGRMSKDRILELYAESIGIY